MDDRPFYLCPMSKANPYAILFEPVKIGPVVAPNRFYQVPHACGMGHLRPQAHSAMRAMKAEGGWGVVCTEECEIHPTSDLSPYSEQRLWDEKDIPALSLMVEKVKAHGSLAGIELVHNGHMAPNLFSRLPALAPLDIQLDVGYPKMARAMDKQDIKDLRAWHRRAVKNAKAAGFDIIYVYAGHNMTITQHFLSPRYNQRTDEYGGSLENRARLTRELLEEAQETAAGDCAIALRLAVDEQMGEDGIQAHEDGRAIVEHLAKLPDLWDVNVSDWPNDTISARFEPNEGAQVEAMSFVKETTSKPTVGVGRFTSPDLMVKLVKNGVLDLIGAARPSIADPLLPNKIREGRIEEIRECIGCNICASCDSLGVPIRCTQNPTMGEEWRRGWHPEIIEPKKSDKSVLIVGAGPSGLECALQLGRRGYQVTLAEESKDLGGRALGESKLKGLSSWRRVADNRTHELQQMANVSIYTNSRLSAQDVVEFDCDKVFLATGAKWRRDGTGRSHNFPLTDLGGMRDSTPDTIMLGRIPSDPVVIYDDDHGYMGGVLADHIAACCNDVTFVTTASVVSPFTINSLEQDFIQRSLVEAGVKIYVSTQVLSLKPGCLELQNVYGGEPFEVACTEFIPVTARTPDLELKRELDKLAPDLPVEVIGDALMPGLIADATFSGHLAARSFEANEEEIETGKFMREMPSLPPTANF